MLGAREQAWSIFNGKMIVEMTTKEIRDSIKAGIKICGLKLSDNNPGLELDTEGFFTTNLMEHRHCNNFKPMIESDCMANMMFTVIGSHVENERTMYDCISSQFEQTKLTGDEVKTYIKLGLICSGAKLDGDKIIVAPLEYEKEAPKTEEKKPENKVEPKAKTEKK